MAMLFVDNNAPTSNFLTAMLRAHYPLLEVLVAHDKESTLVNIHDKQPSIVIIDAFLYWSNEVALANLIKNKCGNEIHVILISEVQVPLEDSLDAVLVRSFPIDALFDRVDSWLTNQQEEIDQSSNNASLLVKLKRLLSASDSR